MLNFADMSPTCIRLACLCKSVHAHKPTHVHIHTKSENQKRTVRFKIEERESKAKSENQNRRARIQLEERESKSKSKSAKYTNGPLYLKYTSKNRVQKQECGVRDILGN